MTKTINRVAKGAGVLMTGLALNSCAPAECTDHGIKVDISGRYTVSGEGATQRELGTCLDAAHGRNCDPVRDAYEEVRNGMFEMIACDEQGNPQLPEGDLSSVFLIDPLYEGLAASDGDCNGVLTRSQIKIERILKRVECDEDGKPFEKLGFGEAEGGINKGCGGGPC